MNRCPDCGTLIARYAAERWSAAIETDGDTDPEDGAA